MTSILLFWIIFLPLMGALANGLGGKTASRGVVSAIGVGSVSISFLLSIVVFFKLAGLENGAPITYDLYDWFTLSLPQIGDVTIGVSFLVDHLSGVMLMVVTGIGLLIHIYSLSYMEDDEGFPRFFTYLNLFMASMLILILADNFVLMFVGWEGVGLCSYLLIGYDYNTKVAPAAGKKAFIVNRIGDFGVLIGMFILLMSTQSLEFAEINVRTAGLSSPLMFGSFSWFGASTATVACLFIFLGCAGKSAQIPLYVWLPDAMAGPTPVSALIHAATMVTAGIYLCCRLSGVFVLSPTAMSVIAIIGALTALLAASIALVQNQLKKILAYSTVSQLGFMFAAVGCGAFSAGIFHVYTHAFFKACLFLGAGAVMHAVHAHGDADIRKLGGLRKKLPTVHWTFAASCLAIAGVPFFAGFWSKDEILLGAINGQGFLAGGALGGWVAWFVFAILVVAATMTAFYMGRMYFITFWGDYRSAAVVHHHDEEGEEGEAHEEPEHDEHGYAPVPHRPDFRIRFPLIVLGLGAIFAGFVNLEPVTHLFHSDLHGPWSPWLETTLASVSTEGAPDWWAYLAAGAGLLAMGVGIALAYVRYGAGGAVPSDAPATGLAKAPFNKWYVDEIYDATFVRLARGSAIFSAGFDKYVIDGLTKLVALLVQGLGWLITRAQTGVVYTYGAVMIVGMIGLGWWFFYPHANLEGQASEMSVNWTTPEGYGYVYRWDCDNDHEFDIDWSAENHSAGCDDYTADDFIGYALVVQSQGNEPVEIEIDGSGSIPDNLLGLRWNLREEGEGPRFSLSETEPEDGGPSLVKVVIHRNAATVRVGGEDQTDETIQLAVGDVAQIEGAMVRVAGIVEATVEVRNMFDNISSDTEEIVVSGAPNTAADSAAAGTAAREAAAADRRLAQNGGGQ